ncbi:MAG: hypothetical protein AAF701_10235, partial [Pseudomonadota bacterium]
MRGIVTIVLVMWAAIAGAQDLSGLARAVSGGVQDHWNGDSTLTLGLTAAVPYRVQALNAPDRIKISFQTVDFTPFAFPSVQSDLITSITPTGPSELVITLAQPALPMLVSLTQTTGGAVFSMRLQGASKSAFDAQALRTAPATTAIPAAPLPQRRNTGDRPWVVAIDPGHGGVDPGATTGDITEADLML